MSQELNILLAVDTSGSTIEDSFYLKSIFGSFPKFSNFIESTYPDEDIRLGLASWDDNVDFIIKPTNNYTKILKSLENLSADETEFTDLNQVIYSAENAFEKSKKYSKNIIIIILNGGEFQGLSVSPNIGKYKLYCIALNVHQDSGLWRELKNISLNDPYKFYALAPSASSLENILERILERELSPDMWMHVDSSILKEDILAQKNNKKIVIKNMFIDNDLYLNQTRISNELQFSDCIFNGVLDLSYSNFQSPVRFENVKFRKVANFHDANFFDNVEFVDVQFCDRSLFSGASFNKNVLFYKNIFSKNAFFDGARFLNMVQFEEIDILGYGLFNMAQFYNTAIFKDISIKEKTFLRTVTFLSDVILRNITFKDQVIFNGSVFKGDLEISKSSFKSRFDFSNSAIFGKLKLLGNRFEDNLDFTNSSANDISFKQSVMLKKSKILIYGLNLTHFDTRWNDIDDHIAYDKYLFSNIMRIYNDREWFDDYDECYYDYKFEHMMEEQWGTQKINMISAWVLCGFGKKISYILGWSLLIILICSIIFWAGDGLKTTQQSSDNEQKKTSPFDAIYFSSILFVAQAPSEFRPIGRYRYIVIIEGILGWILLGVLVAVLIGILTR